MSLKLLQSSRAGNLHQAFLELEIVPYFFGYKEFLSFQNSPKDLDPSYKMDLDLWDCLERVKLVL